MEWVILRDNLGAAVYFCSLFFSWEVDRGKEGARSPRAIFSSLLSLRTAKRPSCTKKASSEKEGPAEGRALFLLRADTLLTNF